MKNPLAFVVFLIATALLLTTRGGDGGDAALVTGNAEAAVLAHADTGELPILRRIARARSGQHDFGTGSPAPDGRTFPYVDWTHGDVALLDLTTDRTRNLTRKGAWGENGSWAENAVPSPDGRRVAFLYGNVEAQGEASFQYELRIMDADGSDQRVVRRPADHGEYYYWATDWSEEHGILLEHNPPGGGTPATLHLLDPESGDMRQIFDAGEGEAHPHSATFSPDESRIAVDLGSDVVVLDLQGREIARTEGHRLQGWSASGSGILTYGAGDGDTGFWYHPLRGDRFGEARLLRGSVFGARPLGAAGDRYFYMVSVGSAQVGVGSADLASGEILSEAEPVGSAAAGGTQWPAWSPDGRSLAYLRRMPGQQTFQLMLRSADGSDVRRVVDLPHPRARRLAWHPGGESIYYSARPQGAFRLFRVDLVTGEVEDAGPGDQGFAFSPDGTVLYARRVRDENGEGAHGIEARSLATGRQLWFHETDQEPDLSLAVLPDGRVAFGAVAEDANALRTIAPDGTDVRELVRVALPDLLSPGSESLSAGDRGTVRYRVWREEENRAELWEVSAEGGDPVRVLDRVPRQFTMHPDGTRFAALVGDSENEIWVMEGVEEALRRQD